MGQAAGNRDSLARMAMAFNTMRRNPDPGLAARMGTLIDQRRQQAEGVRIQSAQDEQRNMTVEWLRRNGMEREAELFQLGLISPSDLGGMLTAKPEQPDPTALMQNYQFLLSQGYTKEQALAAVQGGQTINVNSGQMGPELPDLPAGYTYARDAKGNPIMEDYDVGNGQIVKRPVPIPLPGTDAEQTARDVEGQQASAIDNAQLMLDTIDGALNDPALGYATGLNMWLANIPGTGARRARTRVDQLQGQVFLDAYNALKGGGQITEVEGQKAEAARARLDRAQKDEDFVEALNELRGIVVRALARAKVQSSGREQMLTDEELEALYGD